MVPSLSYSGQKTGTPRDLQGLRFLASRLNARHSSARMFGLGNFGGDWLWTFGYRLFDVF